MFTLETGIAVPVTLHLLASTVWVGGMFFSLAVLRPSCGDLEPAVRVKLMSATVQRFFKWVWGAVILLLATGYWMVFGVFGGIGNVGWSVDVMLTLGNLMAVIFLYAYFVPFQQLRHALAAGKIPEASARLNVIRKLIMANLIFGFALVLSGGLGR